MNRKSFVTVTAFLAVLSAALCVARPAPSARLVAANTPPMDPATLAQSKSLYSEKCSACHNLPVPEEKGFTRAEWQRTVDMMLTRYHASNSIAPAEAVRIVDYLATFAPRPDARRGRNGGGGSDPWATNADDIWTVAPATTRVFNFVEPGSLAEFGMIAAGTPGPAPVWQMVQENSSPDGMAALIRPVAPAPSRFALLMDRKDQARNLDVQVRFHIQAGKVSPAVGIVFGFAGPKNYEVLVYNQARNDLSLLRVAEPAHTTLQQTPVVLPPTPTTGPAVTAAAVPPPAPARTSGWHTLRLLVKDGQIRGWLDMNKRISTQDAAYQGGKVGLWAQGDTVAAFQDWLVDVYDGTGPASPVGA